MGISSEILTTITIWAVATCTVLGGLYFIANKLIQRWLNKLDQL